MNPHRHKTDAGAGSYGTCPAINAFLSPSADLKRFQSRHKPAHHPALP